MNAELPPLKNGEHNFENASTIDCVITPSRRSLHAIRAAQNNLIWDVEPKSSIE